MTTPANVVTRYKISKHIGASLRKKKLSRKEIQEVVQALEKLPNLQVGNYHNEPYPGEYLITCGITKIDKDLRRKIKESLKDLARVTNLHITTKQVSIDFEAL